MRDLNTINLVTIVFALLLCGAAIVACRVPVRAWARGREALLKAALREQRPLLVKAAVGLGLFALAAVLVGWSGAVVPWGLVAWVVLMLVVGLGAQPAFERWNCTNGNRSPRAVLLEQTDKPDVAGIDAGVAACKIWTTQAPLPEEMRKALRSLSDEELRIELCEQLSLMALRTNPDGTIQYRTDDPALAKVCATLRALADAPPAVRRVALARL